VLIASAVFLAIALAVHQLLGADDFATPALVTGAVLSGRLPRSLGLSLRDFENCRFAHGPALGSGDGT
jgi:hypothetical protein